MFCQGGRNLPLCALSPGLIMESTWDGLTRENNQIQLHTHVWTPYIHERVRDPTCARGVDAES